MTTTLYADGATLRVELMVKAQKVRCPVRILHREPSVVLLNWDTINPHQAKDREMILAKLPADRRAEARPLVESLPDMVALASAALDADAAKLKGPGTVLTYEEIEPWAHEVEGAPLLDTLSRTFQLYLVLPAGAADALALWVLFAYAHDAFDVSALVIVNSPTSQCGKTRLLEVLFVLAPKADLSVDPSDASLYRAIEEHHPSLLLDESDGLDFKARKALRSLFNSGHYRTTAWIRRCVGDGAAMEVRNFSTWCPKVLAGIGRLPDTITNRAVVIRMERKPRSARVQPFRLPQVRAALQPVRSQAARWAQDHLDALRDADPAVPPGLTDRQADNWRPLLAIADAAGGAWPERARRAAALLSAVLDPDDVSVKEQLLVDVAAFAANYPGDLVPTAELLGHLHQQEERPWDEWGRQRKPITPHALAAELRGFKLAPEFKREGAQGSRGYRKPAILRAARPYTEAGVSQIDTSDTRKPDIELESPPIDTAVSIERDSNMLSDHELSLVSLQEHPLGRNGTSGPLRLVAEPRPLPLVRLLAGEQELARIASAEPEARHVRLGLSALARARYPEWADRISAFLGNA